MADLDIVVEDDEDAVILNIDDAALHSAPGCEVRVLRGGCQLAVNQRLLVC